MVTGINGRLVTAEAQYVLKATATRSDGKVVMGVIGLASAAGPSGGQSQIILAADSILMVPSSDPNASPSQFLSLQTVNGVTTLAVPAARIGDLTVGSTAIVSGGVSNFVYNTIAYASRVTSPSATSKTTTIELGRLTTGALTDGRILLQLGMRSNNAAPLWPINTYYIAGSRLLGSWATGFHRHRIYRNSTVVAEYYTPCNGGGNQPRLSYLSNIGDAPGPGLLCVYTLEIYTDSGSDPCDHYHEMPDLTCFIQEFKK